MGQEQRVQNAIETLSEADGLMVGGGRGFKLNPQGGVGSSDDFRDKDGSAISADPASKTLVSGDVEEVVLEDTFRGRSTLNGTGDDTTGKLVSEDEHVVVPIIIKPDTVEVHCNDVPRVVSITRKVKGTSGPSGHFGSRADIAKTDVLRHIGSQ